MNDTPNKPGKDWTDEEIVAVFDWLAGKPMEALVRFAFGFTHDLELAMDVVRTSIMEAFRRIHTYDPARYRGQGNAFLNWLYAMIARAAYREMKRRNGR